MEEEERDIQAIDFQLEEELIKHRMNDMKMFLNFMRDQRQEREKREEGDIEEGGIKEGDVEDSSIFEKNTGELMAVSTPEEEVSPFHCEKLERDEGEIDRKLKELSTNLRGDEEINRILAKITPMGFN